MKILSDIYFSSKFKKIKYNKCVCKIIIIINLCDY